MVLSMDNSTRHERCKHIFAMEFAIRMGTLKETNKLSEDPKQDTTVIIDTNRSFEDDEYSF